MFLLAVNRSVGPGSRIRMDRGRGRRGGNGVEGLECAGGFDEVTGTGNGHCPFRNFGETRPIGC